MRVKPAIIVVAIIIFSVAALPNPLQPLTQAVAGAYFVFLNAACFILFCQLRFKIDHFSLIYFGCVTLFLYVNFLSYISLSSDVQTWIKRTIGLAYTPLVILAMAGVQKRYGDISAIIINCIMWVALFESLSIISLAILYPDTRATNIEGLLVYSIFLVAGAYFSALRFRHSKSSKYALLYLLFLGSASMTGSRGLTIATLLPIMLFLKLRPKNILLIAPVIVTAVIFSNDIPSIARTIQSSSGDLLTLSAKFSELGILLQMFFQSPIIGVGFGLPFQTPFDLEVFTYSHNWIFFALGYGGILGVFLHIAPLVFFALKTWQDKGWLLFLGFIIFYASSTTYTNFKHSIMVACVYVIALGFSRQKKSHLGVSRKTKEAH